MKKLLTNEQYDKIMLRCLVSSCRTCAMFLEEIDMECAAIALSRDGRKPYLWHVMNDKDTFGK